MSVSEAILFHNRNEKKSKRIDWLEMSSEHDFPFPLMTRTQQVSVSIGTLLLASFQWADLYSPIGLFLF